MPHSNNLCYEFGPFRFNVGQRVLTQAEVVISLGEKATEVLLFLLRNAGQLVGKEELMKGVWPDSFVEEANLTQNIFTLRRALGDDRRSARYIETLPRRGYRFVAEVRECQVASRADARGEGSRTNVDRPPPCLAVLPLVNATGNESLEYLAEGVSSNIINNLSTISKLRVMSRSSLSRHKGTDIEPMNLALNLRVDAVLVGKIISLPGGFTISAELVDGHGWLLWGHSFDCQLTDILEVQDEIARQISGALRLKLTGEEEQRITTRYTESSRAYQAYIEGRFHWSRYTRTDIEKAIVHFREAIEIDPNYALAYAGIVDCYLRLAINYLPPDNYVSSVQEDQDFERTWGKPSKPLSEDTNPPSDVTSSAKVKLRHEWDWREAERELRRANELNTNYPAAHQWRAAYMFCRRLLHSLRSPTSENSILTTADSEITQRIPSIKLTPSEEVQVFCAVAREQIDVGNYEAACLVLTKWWALGKMPKLAGLSSRSCADLLFTAGELAGFVASARQVPLGQKNAETLLSGAIAFFEQLGSASRAAEGRIELAFSYYRQGNFDLGRSLLLEVLNNLSLDESELRSLVLIRLASLERHAGRLRDALARLEEAKSVVELSGPWATGRRHLELGATYKDLAAADEDDSLFDRSLNHHLAALYEFEAIGNLRLLAIAENNLGLLKMAMHRLNEAEIHLQKAWVLFDQLGDKVRRSQVDDTIARLLVEQGNFDAAEKAVSRAVSIFEGGDEDALLAEALTTKGMVQCKLNRYSEAKRLFESAHGVALRCGDREGAGRALLILLEELGTTLSKEERMESCARLNPLLAGSQQPSIQARVRKIVNKG